MNYNYDDLVKQCLNYVYFVVFNKLLLRKFSGTQGICLAINNKKV